jgi:hypothetical protein
LIAGRIVRRVVTDPWDAGAADGEGIAGFANNAGVGAVASHDGLEGEPVGTLEEVEIDVLLYTERCWAFARFHTTLQRRGLERDAEIVGWRATRLGLVALELADAVNTDRAVAAVGAVQCCIGETRALIAGFTVFALFVDIALVAEGAHLALPTATDVAKESAWCQVGDRSEDATSFGIGSSGSWVAPVVGAVFVVVAERMVGIEVAPGGGISQWMRRRADVVGTANVVFTE